MRRIWLDLLDENGRKNVHQFENSKKRREKVMLEERWGLPDLLRKGKRRREKRGKISVF